MRTSVGWFSSPEYNCYLSDVQVHRALDSKGYRSATSLQNGSRLRRPLKQLRGRSRPRTQGLHRGLAGVCGSRDYVFFMDAAVTERLSQEGSLKTYLEEETELGGETGGKLRHTILTGFNSEAIMSAVRALALICDACLWMLLRRISSEAQHILDVLPKMWTETLAFFPFP